MRCIRSPTGCNEKHSYVYWAQRTNNLQKNKETVSEFNEFEPRLTSAKNRFQLSAGINLKIFNTILSGTNHI